MMVEARQQSSSRVVGVVYTDLICYIIPGGLLVCGSIYCAGMGGSLLNHLKDMGAGMGLLLTLAAVAVSWFAGLCVSAARWLVTPILCHGLPTSLSQLLGGRARPSTLSRLHLPREVCAQIRKRILRDMSSLGVNVSVHQEASNARSANEDDLIDCYWHILRGDLRESNLALFPYLDRWRDIHTARQHSLLVMVALGGVYGVRMTTEGASLDLLGFLAALAIVVGGLLLYRYALPSYEYSLMHPAILRYFVGEVPLQRGGLTAVQNSASPTDEVPMTSERHDADI